MSTFSLAEHYLRYGGFRAGLPKAESIHNFIMDRLAPPSGNPKTSLTADRFTFTSLPASAVRPFFDASALTMEQIILGAARTPSDCFWIEYPDDQGHAGILCTHLAEDAPLLVISVYTDPYVTTALSVIELNLEAGKSNYNILWIHDKSYRDFIDWDNSNLIASLFLLNIPRLHTIKTALSKGTKRIHSRKIFPPIEYKKVKITVGQGGSYYSARKPGETATEHANRLHHVVGHFRTYTHEYGSGGTTPRVGGPVVAWVPPHWRGSAERGLLLREHIVSTEGKSP